MLTLIYLILIFLYNNICKEYTINVLFLFINSSVYVYLITYM